MYKSPLIVSNDAVCSGFRNTGTHSYNLHAYLATGAQKIMNTRHIATFTG